MPGGKTALLSTSRNCTGSRNPSTMYGPTST